MSVGVMFHHFGGAAGIGAQGELSGDDFVRIIKHIGPGRILGAQEWYERFTAGNLNERDVCLTFDDALKSQVTTAVPIMQDFGLTAFFYVYSSIFENVFEKFEVYRHFRSNNYKNIDEFYEDFYRKANDLGYSKLIDEKLSGFTPEKYLSGMQFYTREDRIFRFVRDQILGPDNYESIMDEMILGMYDDQEKVRNFLWMNEDDLSSLERGGHVIGLHSYSHPTNISALGFDDQLEEYERNRNHLEGVLESPVLTMSHPSNSYNADTLRLLRQMGVKMGFRADGAMVENRSEFELPRMDCADIRREIKS